MSWVRHPSFKKPDWESFLAIWLVRLRSWISFANCSLPRPMASVFATAVHGMLAEGKLSHPGLGNMLHHTSQPPRKKRKLVKTKELGAKYQREIDRLIAEGWSPVYSDGSSTPAQGRRLRVGGYGVSYGDERDFFAPLPTEEEQTNNRAELRAGLHALEHASRDTNTLLITDSQYLSLGISGRAAKWKRRDWHNKKGEVSHRDLWERILSLSLALGPRLRTFYAPSHSGIKGNEAADRLAEKGRLLSPLIVPRPKTSRQALEANSPSASDADLDTDSSAMEDPVPPDEPAPTNWSDSDF